MRWSGIINQSNYYCDGSEYLIHYGFSDDLQLAKQGRYATISHKECCSCPWFILNKAPSVLIMLRLTKKEQGSNFQGGSMD
jgi:hypothetical protein